MFSTSILSRIVFPVDQIVPDQSIFDLPVGRPESPPIAQLF